MLSSTLGPSWTAESSLGGHLGPVVTTLQNLDTLTRKDGVDCCAETLDASEIGGENHDLLIRADLPELPQSLQKDACLGFHPFGELIEEFANPSSLLGKGHGDQTCHSVFTCDRRKLGIVVALRCLDEGRNLFPLLQELDLGISEKLLRLGLAEDVVRQVMNLPDKVPRFFEGPVPPVHIQQFISSRWPPQQSASRAACAGSAEPRRNCSQRSSGKWS